jgi:hypothetical protein
MAVNVRKAQKSGKADHGDIRRLGVLVEAVHGDVRLVAEQYGSIKQTLDTHTDMIGSIKEDVEVIKMDIEFIKTAVKKKVDIDEFSALERRVALLERRR